MLLSRLPPWCQRFLMKSHLIQASSFPVFLTMALALCAVSLSGCGGPTNPQEPGHSAKTVSDFERPMETAQPQDKPPQPTFSQFHRDHDTNLDRIEESVATESDPHETQANPTASAGDSSLLWNQEGFHSLGVSLGGKFVITSRILSLSKPEKSQIEVWQNPSGKRISTWQTGHKTVAVDVSETGRYAAVFGELEDGKWKIHAWDVRSKMYLYGHGNVRPTLGGRVDRLHITADGSHLFVTPMTVPEIFQIERQRTDKISSFPALEGEKVIGIALTENPQVRHLLTSNGNELRVTVQDKESGDRSRSFSGSTGRIAASADGRTSAILLPHEIIVSDLFTDKVDLRLSPSPASGVDYKLGWPSVSADGRWITALRVAQDQDKHSLIIVDRQEKTAREVRGYFGAVKQAEDGVALTLQIDKDLADRLRAGEKATQDTLFQLIRLDLRTAGVELDWEALNAPTPSAFLPSMANRSPNQFWTRPRLDVFRLAEIRLTPDGSRLAAMAIVHRSDTYHFFLWDAHSHVEIARHPIKQLSQLYLTPDGDRVFVIHPKERNPGEEYPRYRGLTISTSNGETLHDVELPMATQFAYWKPDGLSFVGICAPSDDDLSTFREFDLATGMSRPAEKLNIPDGLSLEKGIRPSADPSSLFLLYSKRVTDRNNASKSVIVRVSGQQMETREVDGHFLEINCSADGRVVAVADQTQLLVWSRDENRLSKPIVYSSDPTYDSAPSLTVSHDGKYVGVAAYWAEPLVFVPATGEVRRAWQWELTEMLFAPEGSLIAHGRYQPDGPEEVDSREELRRLSVQDDFAARPEGDTP